MLKQLPQKSCVSSGQTTSDRSIGLINSKLTLHSAITSVAKKGFSLRAELGIMKTEECVLKIIIIGLTFFSLLFSKSVQSTKLASTFSAKHYPSLPSTLSSLLTQIPYTHFKNDSTTCIARMLAAMKHPPRTVQGTPLSSRKSRNATNVSRWGKCQ